MLERLAEIILDHRDTFWTTLFFTMIIASMLLVGVINQ